MQGKVMSEHSASHDVGVGIDVCKEWLDIHILPAGAVLRFSNTKKGRKQLLCALKPLGVRIVVVEATGKYHRGVHRFLHDARLSIAVVNPLRARLFAESLGALAKTDSVDARMLAAFDLMAQLDKVPDGMTLSDVSKRMMVSNGNVTGLVERLVESGHLDRRTSDTDRRVQVIRLTKAGRAEFRKMAAEHESWIAGIFSDLAPKDVRDLMRLLAKAKASARKSAQARAL